MEGGVYLLCSGTALCCAQLLFRGYRRSKVRLLFWCAVFFAATAIDNAVVFVDAVLVPDWDLSFPRRMIPLAGVLMLLYGLICDVD